jgi:tape measure domain-containing protein
VGFMRSMALGAVIGVELASSTLGNIAAVGSALDGVRQKAGLNMGSLAGVATGLGGLAAAGTAVVGTMSAIAYTGLQAAASWEQTQIAFTTLLHSHDKAMAFLGDLQEFAKSTPFQMDDLTVASRKMLAFGWQSEQVIPTLRSIGDAVAAMGGGSDMVDRVTHALGLMKVKGHTSAREMNELLETGVFGWQDLAKSIGITTAEAMDRVEKKQITFDQVMQAFVQHSTDAFGGMMEEQSKTFLGRLSNMKDAAELTMKDLFTPMLDALKPALDFVQAMEAALGGPQMKAFAEGMGLAAGYLVTMARVGALFVASFLPAGTMSDEFAGQLGVIVVMGTAVLAVLSPIAAILAGAAGMVFMLGDAFVPLVAVIGAGLLAGLVAVADIWTVAQARGLSFMGAVHQGTEILTTAWGAFQVQFNEVLGDISGPAMFIVQALQGAWVDLLGAVDDGSDGLGATFKSLGASAGRMVGWIVKAVVVLAELGAMGIRVGALILHEVAGPISKVSQFFLQGVVGISSAFTDVVGSMLTDMAKVTDNPIARWALKKLGIDMGAQTEAPKLQMENPFAGRLANALDADARMRAAAANPDVKTTVNVPTPTVKATIHNEVTLDGKKIAQNQKEREVELTERAGFSIDPFQRRSILERSAVVLQ